MAVLDQLLPEAVLAGNYGERPLREMLTDARLTVFYVMRAAT